MGWFSPVKGSMYSLAQVDKTLPVDESVETLERGNIVVLSEDATGKSTEGVWKLAGASDKLLYVAFQDYSDPTAGFAGTSFDPAGGKPRVTGIDLAQDGEYETTVFDTKKTYKVGQPLYAVDGKITNDAGGAENPYILGYVTAPTSEKEPNMRWINNAIATPPGCTDQRLAYRTGARMAVLRFKTAV